jgi:hypothetical protein
MVMVKCSGIFSTVVGASSDGGVSLYLQRQPTNAPHAISSSGPSVAPAVADTHAPITSPPSASSIPTTSTANGSPNSPPTVTTSTTDVGVVLKGNS